MTSASASAYAAWVSELDMILKGQRGAPALDQLSGAELHSAFSEGVTPLEFATAPRCFVRCSAPAINADPYRQRISELTRLPSPSTRTLIRFAIGLAALVGLTFLVLGLSGCGKAEAGVSKAEAQAIVDNHRPVIGYDRAGNAIYGPSNNDLRKEEEYRKKGYGSDLLEQDRR